MPVLVHSLGFVGGPKGNGFTCWQGWFDLENPVGRAAFQSFYFSFHTVHSLANKLLLFLPFQNFVTKKERKVAPRIGYLMQRMSKAICYHLTNTVSQAG